MRLSDPQFNNLLVAARLEALRGGRPLPRAARRVPRRN
jgi:hypothetical protein